MQAFRCHLRRWFSGTCSAFLSPLATGIKGYTASNMDSPFSKPISSSPDQTFAVILSKSPFSFSFWKPLKGVVAINPHLVVVEVGPLTEC